MTRILSLDSDIFRYTNDDELRALRLAGFELRVSALALSETWASAITQDDPALLNASARRLARHSREKVPVEPTLEVYLLEGGGTLPEIAGPATADDHRRHYALAWEIATRDSLTQTDLEEGAFLVASVESQRARWLRFCAPWRDRMDVLEGIATTRLITDGVEPTQELVAARAAGLLAELEAGDREHQIAVVEGQVREVFAGSGVDAGRIEALRGFARVMAYRGVLGGSGVLPPKHDAGDAQQLAHFCVGTMVATRDERFIEAIEAAGAVQAPWVCTAPQLLQAPPEGLPIGADLDERAARFVRQWVSPARARRGSSNRRERH